MYKSTMALRDVLVFVALAALVYGSEVDEGEQKKRGAGKTSNLNAIPTGAQKPEYTYSIYSQTSNSQSNPSQSYQSQQVPSSFYPSQGPSQYYTSANSQPESTSSYPAHPQINLLPPPISSQFVPLNFVPNPGYQSKFQIIPSKGSNGNIQLAIIPQAPAFQSPVIPFQQQLFSPNSHQSANPQNQLLSSLSPGNFNVAPNYQPLSLGSPYLGQSPMFLVTQPNPSLYNSLQYPNPVQSFYNYYPTNSPPKYSLTYGSSQPSSEYEKVPNSIQQSISKDENDVSAHTSEYITPSETSNYKNAYTTSRGNSYPKLT